MKRILIAATMVALLSIGSGCSRKGSSSLNSNKRSSQTSQSTPRVRSSQTNYETLRAERLKAEQEAEAKAKAEAEKAAQERAEIEAREKAKAEKAAAQAKAEAEAAAAKAKAEAEARAKEAAEAKVVVRQEKVKVVETKAKTTDSNARYHIIIGSFKVLNNARQLCQDAIKNDFLPSIMENEDGMFRVSVYSGVTEEAARTKIKDIRLKFPEYVGTWLLVEKR